MQNTPNPREIGPEDVGQGRPQTPRATGRGIGGWFGAGVGIFSAVAVLFLLFVIVILVFV